MLNSQQLQGLFQYGMVLCGDRELAKDLVQAAIENYLAREKAHIDQPIAYLRRSMKNAFIDHYRKRQRYSVEVFEEGGTTDISLHNFEQLHIQRDLLDKLWPELDSLDREILYHWAVLGYSTDECCAELEIPRGSLLSRIHRLRKRLKSHPIVQSGGALL